MYFNEDKWWVSPYNDVPEVKSTLSKGQNVTIHDATLRDGEQTPGVTFSVDDKIKIAEGLIEVGVTRIEAGMPAVSKDDFKAIGEIAKRFPEAEIYSFARATKGDIDMALDCGVKGVVIEIPIGYPKLRDQFGWTWENVLEKSIDCINYAKEKNLKAVYFPYDTTRARPDDLENLLKGIMKYSPPTSVGLVDTMGCAMPQTIAYMVRWMKELTNNLPIEVHTHNDFGMAVACELAGVAAGAEVIHSCVNGLGERTGNAALEELILGLHILMGQETPYNLEKLLDLCHMVSRISGVDVAKNKPIVGDRNYTRESGIGVDLVVNKPLAMFATSPSLFGRTADIALGKKSGKLSVEYYLNEMGVKGTDEQVASILADVKQLGIDKKGLVTLEEFKNIAKKYL